MKLDVILHVPTWHPSPKVKLARRSRLRRPDVVGRQQHPFFCELRRSSWWLLRGRPEGLLAVEVLDEEVRVLINDDRLVAQPLQVLLGVGFKLLRRPRWSEPRLVSGHRWRRLRARMRLEDGEVGLVLSTACSRVVSRTRHILSDVILHVAHEYARISNRKRRNRRRRRSLSQRSRRPIAFEPQRLRKRSAIDISLRSKHRKITLFPAHI